MAKVLVRVYLVTNGPYVAENVNVCKQMIGGHQTSPDFSSDRFCLLQQAEQFFLRVSDGLLDFFLNFGIILPSASIPSLAFAACVP